MANLGDILLLGLVVFLFFMVWGMQVFQSVHIAQAYKEQQEGNGFSTFRESVCTTGPFPSPTPTHATPTLTTPLHRSPSRTHALRYNDNGKHPIGNVPA